MTGKQQDTFASFFQRTAADNIGVSSMNPDVMARELKSQNREAVVAGWGRTNSRYQSGQNQLVSD